MRGFLRALEIFVAPAILYPSTILLVGPAWVVSHLFHHDFTPQVVKVPPRSTGNSNATVPLMFQHPVLKIHHEIIGVALLLCVMRHFSLH
jgi:hypothetical protein